MKKNKKFIFSIKCEGEGEELFIKKLKSEVFNKNKTLSLCKNKKHTKLIGGTIHKDSIEGTKNCCNCFIIIDQDNLDEQKIKQLEIKAKKEKISLIISYPCFELILLSLFEHKLIYDKNKIENKLSQIIKVNKYKHTASNLEKIFQKAFSSNDKTKETLNIFEENLKILKNNNKSNFLDLYKLIKGEK